MRDPYRWDAWEFTAKTFVPGVADLLGRSNLRPYLSSSFLASQEADDLRAFYRSLPFASRFDGLAFTTCAILPMLEAVKYDFPAIQKYKILPITRTFIGVYGLQCIFPHEFYYYLHRIVQSASYHCLKIGPMKERQPTPLGGVGPDQDDQDGHLTTVWSGPPSACETMLAVHLRSAATARSALRIINASRRWMVSATIPEQGGPLSSQDPIAILSNGGDLVDATRKAVTMYGVFGCGSEDKDEKWREFCGLLCARWTWLNDNEHFLPPEIVTELFKAMCQEGEVTLNSFWTKVLALPDCTARHRFTAFGSIDVKQASEIGIALAHIGRVHVPLARRLEACASAQDTMWTMDQADVAALVNALGLQHYAGQDLYEEITQRVCEEIADFSRDELLQVLEAFVEGGMYPRELIKHAGRVIHEGMDNFTPSDFMRLARMYQKMDKRHDTFCRAWIHDVLHKRGVDVDPEVCNHSDSEGERKYNLVEASFALNFMKQLRVNSGTTEWWDKEADYRALNGVVINGFCKADERGVRRILSVMSPRDVSFLASSISRAAFLKNSDIEVVVAAIMDRLRYLLTPGNEVGVPSRDRAAEYLPQTMEHLVRCGRNRRKDKYLDCSWVAIWLCKTVYSRNIHQIVSINRSLGHLGYSDLNYHRIWVNFYLDRLDSLLKTDITMIKDTFNKLKLHDEDIGRDLFWRLGLRFQQCVINTSAARFYGNRVNRRIRRIG
ncbi:hypothetical protein Pmar_PMAR017107 [Perkinsus marinus ATCC 50983]|uniref:Uncharacterized protein n=1 Tax=Perkinsus marinus (strain ATCC 50983 / TXsc) TaxID=423536 RepID=C5LSK8_PERM5|nr:hypothetical protein Pmar_PMAR017107 [Perkinsus marinus ATCC 50983]EER00249.1 hypothetical protein Pmar_PMAR017107 [Perkinsus marinus ATCC 50983]|eukprot:XP_002767531.1 hypothetical protein Pmar_PMAR017107 [Perkinsus marinus ATCC 50983]